MTSSYVIVSIKLCLHRDWYEANAFEITDGVVPDFFGVLRQLHRPVF